MRKYLHFLKYYKKYTSVIFIILGVSFSYAQIEFTQYPVSFTTFYDINDSGNAVTFGGDYFNYSTETFIDPESPLRSYLALNNGEQFIGNLYVDVEDENNNDAQGAYNVGGGWNFIPLSNEVPPSSYDYDVVVTGISENGMYACGRIVNGVNYFWGYIYNIQTDTMTLLYDEAFDNTRVWDVNNNGIAVGYVSTLDASSTHTPAAFDTSGDVTFLTENGTQIASGMGEATAINNNNIIVGQSSTKQPFIYDLTLSTYTAFELPEIGSEGVFEDISDNNLAVGYIQIGNPFFGSVSIDPIIYHADLGSDFIFLQDVLTQNGITTPESLGYANTVSPDGNFIAGGTFASPASLGTGWIVNLSGELLEDNGCSITTPDDITVDAPDGSTGVIVEYTVSSSCEDNDIETTLQLTSGLPSGSEFPIGTTLITYTLFNESGEILAKGGFKVKVNDYLCNISYNDYSTPISYVKFAGIENTTSASIIVPLSNEYFLDQVAEVAQGETYPITVKGNTNGDFVDSYTVFIDWNQDGFFSAAEKINIGNIENSTGEDGLSVSIDITVPVNATLGKTRMRVAKRTTAYDDLFPINACSSEYYRGQTEDYLVNVKPGTLGVSDVRMNKAEIYPNPVSDALHINMNEEIKSISIYNLSGKKISSQKVNDTTLNINVSYLKQGAYILNVHSESGVKSYKIIKK